MATRKLTLKPASASRTRSTKPAPSPAVAATDARNLRKFRQGLSERPTSAGTSVRSSLVGGRQG